VSAQRAKRFERRVEPYRFACSARAKGEAVSVPRRTVGAKHPALRILCAQRIASMLWLEAEFLAGAVMASKLQRPNKNRLSESFARERTRAARSEEPEAPALTPLARVLRQPKKQVTPLDALELASRKWRHGERLDIGQLASELGVARATVFRWVGSREQLYGEVLSQAYARQRAHILRTSRGKGITRLVSVVRKNLSALGQAAPLRTFVVQDPEYAIRVLTSNSSPVQARSIELEKAFLREIMKEARIKPLLDIDTLAFVIVRIGESFLYADVISGRKPEIEKAVAAIRILVVGASAKR
jgi:AcrR family transcriptional regulator